MSFVWSTLKVKNLEESIRFYTEIIGLEVINSFETKEGVNIAFLGKGNNSSNIELIWEGTEDEINIGDDISWGFEVDSLNDLIALLKEKGIEFEGPIEPNPNVRFIFIKDPNGMKIQLIENMQ